MRGLRPQWDLGTHTCMRCRLREATSEELELCSGEGVCHCGERRSHRKPGKWGCQIWEQEGADTGKDDSEGLHSRTQKDDKFKDRSNFRGQEFHDFEAVGQVTASWFSVLHGGAAALIVGAVALKVKDWRSCLGQRQGDKA